jgi:hypothetical protein
MHLAVLLAVDLAQIHAQNKQTTSTQIKRVGLHYMGFSK